MKLKEINRTAIQSWSPAQHHPIYLATGTSAQQLDASFSTNASLEFFELDLADPTLDMKSCGSFSSSHRYHKLVWGPFGMDDGSRPSGVLIAGGENGNVILYDPAKIMSGETDVVMAESERHMGPVRALDVNPFQTNLFASGGNESEIYIWDMNNFGSPMTPGPKTQPPEDISCIAWNRQVQHILASASPSGRASVWDLRKNDLIIKVSDHSNRMHCSGLAWNPEVATQMVLSSEDDRMPVIQMWDLRFATSPLKILEHHTRGVLALAWSLADPDLLLSCGKDNQILCWNPNTAEVLYELPTSSQWCFDIQWCPRNPAVLSAAGFDGHIDIYSIMGGSSQVQSQRHADQISNSFGNMDPFGTGQVLPPLQLPQSSAPPASVNPLKKPPKWIRRPVGASFAFGGKLVSLDNSKPNAQQAPQSCSHAVYVSQVVTETDFLKRSEELQAMMTSGSFVDFCQGKIDSARNQFEKTVWSFLKANFESDVRGKYLELLGYNKEELSLKISAALEEKPVEPPKPLANLSPAPPADTPEAAFDMIAAANHQQEATPNPLTAPELQTEDPTTAPPEAGEDDGDLSADVSAIAEEEVKEEEEEEDQQEEEEEEGEEIPLEEEVAPPMEEEMVPLEVPALVEPPPEAPAASFDFLAPAENSAPAEISSPVEVPTPIEVPPPAPTPAGGVGAGCLSISQDVDGLITQALLTGDFEGAVELCLHDNRMADSIILAIAGGAELLEKTQKTYFSKTHSKISKLISAVVMKDWHDILRTCDLQSWKEALAAVMTYANPEEFSSLCGVLGGRLEASEDPLLQSQACLSFICAGNVEKLVCCWSRAQDGLSPLSLQDLVEKVVILRQAVAQTQSSGPAAIGLLLAERMADYAGLLASQGSLSAAITYLPENTQQVAVQQLRDRLSRALGQQQAPMVAPMAPVHPQQTPVHLQQTPVHPQQTPVQPSIPVEQPAPVVPPHPYAPAQPVPLPGSAPSPQQYYQPVRAASTVTSWSNQTPTALPIVPPPPLGGAPEPQGESLKPPFGMPTSGSAAPPAAAATPAYMYSHQYQPFSQHGQFAPRMGAEPVYHLHHYSSSSSVEPSSPPPPAGFLSHYTSQPPTLYPGQQCPTSHPPPFYSSSSSSCSSSSGASFQHISPGSPVSYTPPLPPPAAPPPPPGVSGTQTGLDPQQLADTHRAGPQNGWNDPPTLNRAPKKKAHPESYTRPAPITAPIMAPLGSAPQPPPGPSGVPQGSHLQQPLATPPSNPATPRTSTEGPPGAPTGDVITKLDSAPTEKIAKKPIPDEHLVLKSTFEGLIQKCLAVASDPQTKRKLDDAHKRLEALYDKLREQTLSPAIIGGLHNMARSIESRSYADGLNIHTHIVSSSNFSETSAFMPVLKVVLTQANRLRV